MKNFVILFCVLSYLGQDVFSQYPIGLNAGKALSPNSISKCPLGYTYADIPAGSLPLRPSNPLSKCPLGYTYNDVPAALASSVNTPLTPLATSPLSTRCPLGYSAADLPATALAPRVPNPFSKCPLGYSAADMPGVLAPHVPSINSPLYNAPLINKATKCPLGYTYADIPPGSLPAIPPNPASKCPLGYTYADVPAALAGSKPFNKGTLGFNAPAISGLTPSLPSLASGGIFGKYPQAAAIPSFSAASLPSVSPFGLSKAPFGSAAPYASTLL